MTSTRLLTGFALSLTILANLGCTSIRARTELPEQDWQRYPGVRRDISDLGDTFGGRLKGPAWTAAVVAPILLVDMPFSATLDTLGLPYDIYRAATAP